jgi:hypothetical protein
MVINQWVDQSATTVTAAAGIALTAGTEVTMLVEYYNQGGPGTLSVAYYIGATAAGPFVAIPATSMHTSAPGGTYTGVQIGTTAGSGDVSVWTFGGNVLVGTSNGFGTSSNGQWVHVCYTYDGSNHTLYWNGDPVAASSTVQQSGTLKYITINGYLGGGANETYNHYVGNTALYNRVLSDDEVMTLYEMQGDRGGITYGLIAAYDFNGGVDAANATTILDMTGNGANLLMTGAGTAPKYSYTNSVAMSNTRQPVST